MRWWHEVVLRHRLTFSPARTWIDPRTGMEAGMVRRPVCSCGRRWVR